VQANSFTKITTVYIINIEQNTMLDTK